MLTFNRVAIPPEKRPRGKRRRCGGSERSCQDVPRQDHNHSSHQFLYHRHRHLHLHRLLPAQARPRKRSRNPLRKCQPNHRSLLLLLLLLPQSSFPPSLFQSLSLRQSLRLSEKRFGRRQDKRPSASTKLSSIRSARSTRPSATSRLRRRLGAIDLPAPRSLQRRQR